MARKKTNFNVAVVGAGMIKFGELFDQSYEDMIVKAYRNCLKSVDKGIDEKEIEAAWFGANMPTTSKRMEAIMGSGLSEPLAFFTIPITRIENACASGSDAVRNAAFAVASGVYETVLVVGVEKMRDIPSRDSLIGQQGQAKYMWWHPRGDTAPALFGQFATAHMHAFGTKREHFAMIAVKNHHNGTLDPYAHFNFEVTVEQVLNAPIVSWPLGLLDCCPTTDGAAALILTRAENARMFTDKPLYFIGTGLACDVGWNLWKRSFTEFSALKCASQQAYEMAGIGPDDIDVAELHDCFTCTELITYEDLGFCKKGEGGKFIEEGCPTLGGDKPCNTSGGLKAKGHPVGATGVAQVCELWWQLRGEATNRQVKGAKIGLNLNLGGSGNICCVNIFSNEPR